MGSSLLLGKSPALGAILRSERAFAHCHSTDQRTGHTSHGPQVAELIIELLRQYFHLTLRSVSRWGLTQYMAMISNAR